MLNAKVTRTSKMKQNENKKTVARVAHLFVHFFAVVVA